MEVMKPIEVCLAVLIAFIAVTSTCPLDVFAQQEIKGRAARKVGEYGYLDKEAGAKELALFGQELLKEPKSKAFIIAYSARIFRQGDADAGSMASMARVLLAYRYGGIEWGRIVLIDGGFREQPTVELYIVPFGASPPAARPSVASSEVVYCPLIELQGAEFVWETNTPLLFRATVKDERTKVTPSFKWSVSGGEIVRGQETSEIVVAQPRTNYERITATVEIGGYSSECQNSQSVSSPERLMPIPSKLQEIPNMACDEELAVLAEFFEKLMLEPRLQGYVVFYGGRKYRGRLARRGESEARAERIRRYIVIERGLAPERLVMVDGGFREEWMAEFWVSPQGAKPPTPTPTLKQEEIRFRRGKVPIREYICTF